MSKSLTANQEFYTTMLHIAIPVSLQSLVTSSLGLIDSIMVGQLGESAINAVGISNRLFSILLFVLLGLTGGTSIFAAQFWGKKDIENISKVTVFTLAVGGLITLIMTLAALVFPRQLLTVFSKDATVISTGAEYTFIVAFSFLATHISLTYAATLRSIDEAKLPMYASFLSVILNTLLNYLLIFGNWGFPALGVKGAAIATLIARIMECAVLVSVTHYRRLPAAIRIQSIFNISTNFIRNFWKTTFPLVAGEFIWIIGYTMYAVIYGRMGTNSFAAISISFPIQDICFGIFSGLSSAALVVLGKYIGSGQKLRAFEYSKKFMKVGLLCSCIMTAIVILISKLYVSNYNVSALVRRYALIILVLFAFSFIIRVSNMIYGSGILRSGGDTRFTLLADVITTWFIGLPIGFFAAFVLKLPIYWVFGLISLEEIAKLFLLGSRIFSKKWLVNLVHDL